MENRKSAPVNEETLDRRVRRTRKLLQNSLLTCMKEKPLGSISMRELCRMSDLCRTTPYLHYKDVLDIFEQLEQALSTELCEIYAANPPEAVAQDPTPLFTGLFALAQKRKELVDVLLNHNGDNAFMAQVAAQAEEYIRQVFACKQPPITANDYQVAFQYGAVLATISGMWLPAAHNPPLPWQPSCLGFPWHNFSVFHKAETSSLITWFCNLFVCLPGYSYYITF